MDLRSAVGAGGPGPSTRHAAAPGDRRPGVTAANPCTLTAAFTWSAAVIWGLVCQQQHVADVIGSHSQDL